MPTATFALTLLIHLCPAAAEHGMADHTGAAARACTSSSTPGVLPHHETVTVTGEPTPLRELGVSSEARLDQALLQSLRSVATDDPVRTAQGLPGSAAGDDFQAQFSVRGTAFHHLGLVVDGTPAPELFHAVHGVENTGSVAMLNRDALEVVTLRAGPHARRDGDWLGATLQVSAREGTRTRTAMRAAVGGTGASLLAEGPIDAARRGSWLVAVRKSYLGWLISKVEPDFESTIGHADGHLKVAYDLSSRQKLQLLVIGGDARYRARTASTANGLLHATSGSTLATLQWEYTHPSWRLAQRVSFVGSEFQNLGALGQELARGYSQAVLLRTDVGTSLGAGWTFDAGVSSEHRSMNHTLRRFRHDDAAGLALAGEQGRSAATTFGSGWAELSRRTAGGGVTLGVRATRRTLGAQSAALPWLLVERRLRHSLSVRAGAGESIQFSALSAAGVDAAPLQPERARSAEAGIEHQLAQGVYWKLSVFGRKDSGLLGRVGQDRLDGMGIRRPELMFPMFDSSLEGTSQGVDVVLGRARAGGVHGWIGYTWAHTRSRDSRTGEAFDADFDQRHTLNAVALYALSSRAELGATLRVGSNFPLVGYFERTADALRLAAARNLVRLPLYARLDLRVSRTFAVDGRPLTLVVEVLNALGRRNLGPADGSIRESLEASGYVERMIPFVPSAGLVVAF
jgi:hypothetical protein